MKEKIFTAVLTIASAVTVSAQEVARFHDLHIVPSTLTSDDKPAPVGNDRNEITIMDSDFKVIKKFNMKGGSTERLRYYETATVKPSGVEIARTTFYDLVIDKEPVASTDVNTMIQKLSEYSGYNDFCEFTDSEGRICCWSPSADSCYQEKWFGTKYPRNYYCIIDGFVKIVWPKYEPVFDQFTIDNAEWTMQEDGLQTSTETLYPSHFGYFDYDSNIGFDEGITVSQTLFNDDDKWEYLFPKLGPVEKSVGDWREYGENENGIILSRYVSEYQPTIGLDIINEDGEVVASLEGASNVEYPYIYKIGGNIYMKCEYYSYSEGSGDVFYRSDPISTSIKEVSRSATKKAPVKVNGRSITVEADGKEVDEAVLFDMGGRRVATSGRRGAGNITLHAADTTHGVYNVALKKKGRIVGAQKIVLK